METTTTAPAPFRKLYGVLSLPAGNQYAKHNGERLLVETLLGTGAADLVIERRGGAASACFAPTEYRLVDAAGETVSLADAFNGEYFIGWQNNGRPAPLVPTQAEPVIDLPELDEQLDDFSKLSKAPATPARSKVCETCNGSGTNAHEFTPGEPVRGGDIHECYSCEGIGRVSLGKPAADAVPALALVKTPFGKMLLALPAGTVVRSSRLAGGRETIALADAANEGVHLASLGIFGPAPRSAFGQRNAYEVEKGGPSSKRERVSTVREALGMMLARAGYLQPPVTGISFYQIRGAAAEGEQEHIYDSAFSVADDDAAWVHLTGRAKAIRKSREKLSGEARYKLGDLDADWTYLNV